MGGAVATGYALQLKNVQSRFFVQVFLEVSAIPVANPWEMREVREALKMRIEFLGKWTRAP